MRTTVRRSLSILILAGACGLAVFGLSAGAALKDTAPSNTALPTITGTATEAQALTAAPGTWTGTTPITYTYAWQHCDATGANCVAVAGATRSTYTVDHADVGATLRVKVTATNSAGTADATSAQTAVVTAAAPPPPAGCPPGTGTVNVSQISSPARLLINSASASPSVIGGSTQSFTLKVVVGNTCGQTVEGALVYATAVPYNMFAIPPEATTDSTGSATLTMSRLRGFPASPRQTLLVLFIRARKSGENLLAGISTRRLVSLRVNLSA